MKLINTLKKKAIEKGLLNPEDQLGLEEAFRLVRDMPYKRASNREPETTIREWRGTCSGKHYLLRSLFSELGFSSKLIACSTVEMIDPKSVDGKLRELLEELEGKFVDIHNYLVLKYDGGEMIVDATFPLEAKKLGLPVNEAFVLGENHTIASDPIFETWEVPADRNPQDFKDELLAKAFTPKELAHRDSFILALTELDPAVNSLQT